MEIRKAVIDDVEDISKIYAQSWKTAYKGMMYDTSILSNKI
ncbi:hypothetical protein ACTPEO_13135 [Clostridioides difficile]